MRTRRADDLSWGFVALNLAGISLLALRSAEIGETAFLGLNLVTLAFWALVAGVKVAPARAGEKERGKRGKSSADVGI